MKLKKITAFILAGALMATSMSVVSADETEVLDGVIEHDLGQQAEGEYGIMLIDESLEEAIEDTMMIPTYMNISGEIVEVEKTEEGMVTSITVDKGEADEVVLIISEETVAIDSNGTPIDLASLEKGAKIDAVQSMAQTMSLPPQAGAYAIILKAEDENAPKYMEIKTISEVEGKKAFESADGNYLIAYDENTEFAPYRTRNIVTEQDLKEGIKVFVWYGKSTKSIPEQALAEKIMILPAPIVEETEEEKEYIITGAEISGKVIDFAKYGNILPAVEDGITYLPVRAIAETIGATVTWDGLTSSIIIEIDDVKAELKIGNDKALVAGEEVTLAAAPKIVDDRTVVGVSVELEKYGVKLIKEEK